MQTGSETLQRRNIQGVRSFFPEDRKNVNTEVAFPLPHRCWRKLRSHVPFPCVNGVLKRLALDGDGNASATTIDFCHEQIVFSASGTFRHHIEIANQMTSTLSRDRPVWFLNVFVKQRVRFAVLHLKTTFLKPPGEALGLFSSLCPLSALRQRL